MFHSDRHPTPTPQAGSCLLFPGEVSPGIRVQPGGVTPPFIPGPAGLISMALTACLFDAGAGSAGPAETATKGLDHQHFDCGVRPPPRRAQCQRVACSCGPAVCGLCCLHVEASLRVLSSLDRPATEPGLCGGLEEEVRLASWRPSNWTSSLR